MREYTGLNSVAQEAIAYQGDKFFKELAIYYGQLKETNIREMDSHAAWDAIVKCIDKYTNLKVVVDHSGGPAMSIPDVNKNNPLLDSFRRGFMTNKDGRKMINNAEQSVRGSVNLADSTVNGVFTTVTHTLYMPLEFVASDFTPEECAAVTLHEVGHLFTYYECIARMVTTNQVLSGLARAYEETMTQAEREAVLISAKKALKLKDLDVEALSKITNKKAVEIVIITNVQKQAKSEIGSDIYDMNNWEQLADLFAQRHGAGRALITSLEKIYRSSYDISFRSTPMYFFIEMVKLLSLVAVIAVGTAIPGLQMFGTWLLVFWAVVDGAGSPYYDRPRARLMRIRDQLVQRTKDRKISKDELKRVNADIEFCDSIISQASDQLAFFTFIGKMISSDLRQRLKAEELQQQLESFANNNIFKQSAQLQELA